MSGNKRRVQYGKNGQYTLTIPKSIAESMRLVKGSTVSFTLDRGDMIIRHVEK